MKVFGSHAGYRRDLLRRMERGEIDDVVAVMDRYASCQDWPWALLFRELDRRYPDSRFVLTTRRIIYGHAMPNGAEALHVERYEAHMNARPGPWQRATRGGRRLLRRLRRGAASGRG